METARNQHLPQSVDVTCLPSPFSARRETHVAEEGRTIREIIDSLGVRQARVLLGDVIVPEKYWGVVRPKSGVKMIVRAGIPEGGDSGKNVLRVVATIAVIYFTGAAGASMTSAGYGAGTVMVAKAAITVAGMYLVNQIAPPASPYQDGGGALPSASNAPAITGTRNEARKYRAIPKIYGRVRTYPPLAAEPYTAIIGSDTYLYQLFLVGDGPLDLSDFKIGTTSIDSYSDITTQARDLSAGDSAPSLYPNQVTSVSVGTTIAEDGEWYEQTTETDTDEITGDIVFPSGLALPSEEKVGKSYAIRVEFQVEYAAAGSDSWTAAPVEGVGAGTSSPATGILLIKAREYGTITRGFRIEFPSRGQYDVRIQRIETRVLGIEGDRYNREKYLGSSYCDGDSWNEWGEEEQCFSVYDDLSNSYETTCTQVTVCYATVEPDKSTLQSEAVWSALRSIKNESPIDYDRGVYVAIRIRASDQLNGIIDRFNCLAEAKLSVWDGSSWTSPQVTRNAAWAYADLLTGDANRRAVSKSRLDVDNLKEWADDLDAAGKHFDIQFIDQATVTDRKMTIASAGRASPAMPDGKYGVVQDKARTEVAQHFTPRNSWGFTGRKAFTDQPHALKVQFVNAETDYQQDERIVYDDGYNAGNATKFETIRLEGITDPDVVWQEGRYHIASARLRPESYEFNVGLENLACTRGDLVRVSHDVPLFGLYWGRIKTVSTDGAGYVYMVTTDEEITMEAGTSYAMRIRLSDGTSVLADVDVASSSETEIWFSSVIDSASAPEGGELFQFGESDSESVLMLVKEITASADFVARLTCIDYNAAVYTADEGTIPAYTSNISLPPERDPNPPPEPVIDSIVSDETALTMSKDGSLVSQIRVRFSVPEDATAPKADAVQVEWRVNEPQSVWQRVTVNVSERQALLAPVVDEEIYDVRLRSVTRFGIESAWVDAEAHEVVGKTSPPPNVTDFSVQQNGTSVVMRWNQVVVADLSGYEIRYGFQDVTTWGNSKLLTKATKGTALTDATLPPGDWDVLIKAIDTSGNYSESAATESVTVISEYDEIVVQEWADLDYPGYIDGFVPHGPTGRLVPDSRRIAGELDWEVFDEFVPEPVAISLYRTTELDAGFTDTVRTWADMSLEPGPGETDTLDYTFSIASREEGGLYTSTPTATEDWGSITDSVTASEDWGSITDSVTETEDWGFVLTMRPWGIGDVEARYIEHQISTTNDGGIFYVDGFTSYVDLLERTEKFQDETIAIGGTTITYDKEFHIKPIVWPIADSESDLFAVKSNVTTTSARIKIFDAAGNDVGGTADIEVIGV